MSKNIKKFLIVAPWIVTSPALAICFIIFSGIGISMPFVIIIRAISGQENFIVAGGLPTLTFVPALLVGILASVILLSLNWLIYLWSKKSILLLSR